MPILRNPLFTGREDLLDALHARLRAEQVVALTERSTLNWSRNEYMLRKMQPPSSNAEEGPCDLSFLPSTCSPERVHPCNS